VSFDHFTYQSGSGSPFDLGFQSITGYCVTGSGSPRINTSSSTQGCAS
jgi:hypothetical protein